MSNHLGIALNATSINKAGGLKNYLDLLMPRIEAFSQKTNIPKESIINKLFGTNFGNQDALKIVTDLYAVSDELGKNTEKINASTGSIQSAFDIMSATTSSKIRIMRNNLGNSLDSIYVILVPMAQFFIDIASKVFGFIRSFIEANPVLSKFLIRSIAIVGVIIFTTSVLAFLSLRLDAMYLKLVKASFSSNGFTAAMGRAGLASLGFLKSLWRISMQLAGQAVGYTLVGAKLLGSFLVGLVSATAAQLGLNIALNANPIGLIVIGIAAAVTAIILMIKYWDEIKKAVISFTQFVWKYSPFRFILNLVENIFPGFKAKVKEIFEYVKGLILGFWEKIKEVFAKVKEFFGFGNDLKAEFEVKYDKDGNPIPITDDKEGLLISDLLFTPTNTDSKSATGGRTAGKSITMTLNIKNEFNMGVSKLKENIDDIADEIVGKINDKMRDAVIALD